ncbi:DMT family transporter [Yunchengibacter salinarum]|uniref:DMT family transporter n=1 Tax=Yunchengibacter salinarum TaxID=3133399 RepID=UPI0035B5F75E
MTDLQKGFLAVLAGGAAIGSAAIFMRLAPVTPTSAAFWRMTLASPALLLWAWWTLSRTPNETRPPRPPHGRTMRDLALVGFWFAADMALWHWAVAGTTVANATLLANMSAVLTALAGLVFFGDRFQGRFYIGLLLALAGAATLIGQSAEVSPDNLGGDLLGLATAFAYAGYLISGGRVRQRHPTAVVMAGSGVVTALFLLPLALSETGAFVPATAAGWLPLIGLGLVTHVLGQSLIMFGLAHLPAAMGSLSLLIQPVVAALLAWLIFGEALGWAHLVGAVLIFSGIQLARRSLKKPGRAG